MIGLPERIAGSWSTCFRGLFGVLVLVICYWFWSWWVWLFWCIALLGDLWVLICCVLLCCSWWVLGVC